MTTEEFTCEGGCSCGEVRYKVRTKPLIVHACHCSYCQRQTGGPHVINACYEADRVTLTAGEVETTILDTPSGAGQKVARCPTCHIAVWSNYLKGGWKERVKFLRAATLDDPSLMPPDVHIFTETKMHWYIIPPDQPSFVAFYDSKTTRTPEAQERIRLMK